MRHAVCYISNVADMVQLSNLDNLFRAWEKNNKRLKIKGILLYSEGNFFQVLEGEKEVVLQLWKKIQSDPRHWGIIQILGRDIHRGSYDGYKAEILKEEKKYSHGLPIEYTEPLKGMPTEIQRIIERMMENFIATRT